MANAFKNVLSPCQVITLPTACKQQVKQGVLRGRRPSKIISLAQFKRDRKESHIRLPKVCSVAAEVAQLCRQIANWEKLLFEDKSRFAALTRTAHLWSV